jgi:Zn-dependent protease/CBS domain-containing protein
MTSNATESPEQRTRREDQWLGEPADAAALSGLRVGRIWGVEVVLDWSLLMIFAIISFDLGMRLFPSWHPDWPARLRWAVALGAAALFLGSVLLHELSHALTARARRVPIGRITLFLFGGVAHMEREPDTPSSEFLIAIAGPLASLLLGFGAAVLGTSLSGVDLAAAAATGDPLAVRAALGKAPPLATLLLWLGPINLMLAVFNLIPGFPLDGGRVLRALLWAWTKDLTRATRWASRAGQLVAWVLMALGLLDIFGGALGSGLWLLVIGWFLNNAAKLSYQQRLLHSSLREARVADIMNTRIAHISAELPISDLVRDHVLSGEQRVFPVESAGHLLGLMRISDVRKLQPAEWSRARVRDVMSPAAPADQLHPEESAERALEQLRGGHFDQLPVMQDSQVIGLVGRGELMRWLEWRKDVARAPA